MNLTGIHTDPDPYEAVLISQGMRVGNMLYVSGQAGYDHEGHIVAGGFLAQGKQAFANLERALRAGGSSLANVAKVTIFVTDMGHFDEVVELRRTFFSKPYPADSIVEVKSLYTSEAMIEIEATAVIDTAKD